jgi:hypothetical protein
MQSSPSRRRSAVAALTAFSLTLASLPPLAQAEWIATPEVARAAGLQGPAAADARTTIHAALAREDVAAALRERGVELAQVRARVDALSDAEAVALAERIDSLPAGAASVLGTLTFLFVLLLITDILGLTKIFPFTRPVR